MSKQSIRDYETIDRIIAQCDTNKKAADWLMQKVAVENNPGTRIRFMEAARELMKSPVKLVEQGEDFATFSGVIL